MARFDQGWVKCYRLRYDHWLEHDLLAWAVLMKLIQWANYEDSPANAKIQLKRGQVATSSLELSKRFRIGRKRIRNVLDELTTRQIIGQQPGHLGTIITILNYDKYQTNEKDGASSSANEGPTEGQPRANEGPLNKEIKNNKKERTKELNTGAKPPSAVAEFPGRQFIAAYCEAYKAKYTVNPVIDGRAQGIAKRVVDSKNGIGPTKAIALVKAYLQMNDQWFLKKKHDLFTFEQNLNSIELFAETGKQITNNLAQQIEISDQNRSVIDDYFREREG